MRKELSFRYISGSGIEIGALHGPLPVSDSAKVTYVDRMTIADLRKHYPELDHVELVHVDVIDDGETLPSFEDNSLDFIIANHMLEHCENPIGALRSHFRKLRTGGIGYYAIPDKNHTFDRERPLDTFDHLILDDKLGPSGSREFHVRDWVTYVSKKHGDDAADSVRGLLQMNYSIHYHVWDHESFYDFIIRTNQYLGNIFTLEEFAKHENEVICILRKGEDPLLGEKLAALPKDSGKELHPQAIGHVEEELAGLRAAIAERDRQIDALLNSASWKATKIPRLIKDALESLWSHVKLRGARR